MDLKEAQELIGAAAENPNQAAMIPAHDLAVAAATVLARNGLLGARASQVTLNVLITEEPQA